MATYGKRNDWEETSAVRFACRFFWCHLWADKSLDGGVSLVKGNLYSAFRQKRRRVEREFFLFAVFNCLKLKYFFLVKETYFEMIFWFLSVFGC